MTGPELQLPTTFGTYALKDGIAKKNAPIVDRVSIYSNFNPLLEELCPVLTAAAVDQSWSYYSWKGKPLGILAR